MEFINQLEITSPEESKYLNLDKYICEDCNRDFTDEVDDRSGTETWDEYGKCMCAKCFEENLSYKLGKCLLNLKMRLMI